MKRLTLNGLFQMVFQPSQASNESRVAWRQWFTFFMTEEEENRPNSLRLPSEKSRKSRKQSELAKRLRKEVKQLKLFIVGHLKKGLLKAVLFIEKQKDKLEVLLFSNAVEFENTSKR